VHGLLTNGAGQPAVLEFLGSGKVELPSACRKILQHVPSHPFGGCRW